MSRRGDGVLRVQALTIRKPTESLTDYTSQSRPKNYATLDASPRGTPPNSRLPVERLSTWRIPDELAEQVGRDYDPFDLVCHIAFDQPPLTRRERADRVKNRNSFGKYGDKARAVLEALLQKYADSGISSVESLEILKVDPLRAFGTPVEIIKLFGGRDQYLAAVREIEIVIYEKVA